MNFSFLPSKIRQTIELLKIAKSPISLARSSSAIDGNNGESYVVAYDDKIFLFSRKLGEHDYLHLTGEFGKNITSLKVRKEGHNCFLDTNINGQAYSLKFSSFEEKNLNPIADLLGENNAQPEARVKDNSTVDTTAAGASSADGGNITSFFEGMIAALMFLSSVDDDIATEEDDYIRLVANNDRKILQSALMYYKAHNLDELLVALGGMNHEQKLCCLANLMELGMSDGALHRSEMTLIKQFCSYMDLSEDEYETIKQVLMIKNKLSVLG